MSYHPQASADQLPNKMLFDPNKAFAFDQKSAVDGGPYSEDTIRRRIQPSGLQNDNVPSYVT